MFNKTMFPTPYVPAAIQLDIADPYGSFGINPMSMVVPPGTTVRWESPHPFVIRFIKNTPFLGMARNSTEVTQDTHELEGTIQLERLGVFEYAVALSRVVGDEGETVQQLEVHTSGEIIVDPGGGW